MSVVEGEVMISEGYVLLEVVGIYSLPHVAEGRVNLKDTITGVLMNGEAAETTTLGRGSTDGEWVGILVLHDGAEGRLIEGWVLYGS